MFNPQDHNTNSSEKQGLVSPEWHLALVSEIEHFVSKSGNDTFKVTFEIIGEKDPHVGEEIPYQYYALAERSAWKFAQLVKAINPQQGAFDYNNPDTLAEVVEGKPLAIKVRHENTKDNQGIVRKREQIQTHRALKNAEVIYLERCYGPSLVPEEPGGLAVGVPALGLEEDGIAGMYADSGPEDDTPAGFDPNMDAAPF